MNQERKRYLEWSRMKKASRKSMENNKYWSWGRDIPTTLNWFVPNNLIHVSVCVWFNDLIMILRVSDEDDGELEIFYKNDKSIEQAKVHFERRVREIKRLAVVTEQTLKELGF